MPGSIPMSLAFNGALVVAGTTLMPGGHGATLNGMSVSVALDGNVVVAGTTLTPDGAVVTMNGRLVSVGSDGTLIIDGSTPRPGATPGAAKSATGASTSSNGGLDSLIVGAFGDRPTVASSTGNSSIALAFEGKATLPMAKSVVFTTVMLTFVMLIRTF